MKVWTNLLEKWKIVKWSNSIDFLCACSGLITSLILELVCSLPNPDGFREYRVVFPKKTFQTENMMGKMNYPIKIFAHHEYRNARRSINILSRNPKKHRVSEKSICPFAQLSRISLKLPKVRISFERCTDIREYLSQNLFQWMYFCWGRSFWWTLIRKTNSRGWMRDEIWRGPLWMIDFALVLPVIRIFNQSREPHFNVVFHWFNCSRISSICLASATYPSCTAIWCASSSITRARSNSPFWATMHPWMRREQESSSFSPISLYIRSLSM